MNGIDCLQYRSGPNECDCYQTARIFADLCRQTNTQYIVNDHVHIAARLCQEGFDAGIWLGQNDISATEARAVLGEDAFIGLSVNTKAEALVANAMPVNAIAANGVFPCESNPYAQQMGIDVLRTMVEMSDHPTIAIGGINHNTLPTVLATGVRGIALSGAILRADDIENATKCIMALCEQYQEHEA